MASLMCSPATGGRVQVSDWDLTEFVLDPQDNVDTQYMSYKDIQRKVWNRPHTSPSFTTRRSDRNMDTDVLIGQTLKLQDWLNGKSVKSLQERSDLEAKSTRQMYNDVLQTEDTFIKDLEELVDYQQLLNARKREMLHKRWDERVHEPIQVQIDRGMNGPQYLQLVRRKRNIYKQYLEHVNKKGHVFLDTIAPEEYYPLALHPVRPSIPTAQTRHLRDPLLSQERQRTAEERDLFRCTMGRVLTNRDIQEIHLPRLPLVPLGRHGTQCNSWLAMPNVDIESPVRLASRDSAAPYQDYRRVLKSAGDRRRMFGLHNKSQVDFEKWADVSPDPSIVDEEMQIQKKRRYPNGTSTVQGPPPVGNQHVVPSAVENTNVDETEC